MAHVRFGLIIHNPDTDDWLPIEIYDELAPLINRTKELAEMHEIKSMDDLPEEIRQQIREERDDGDEVFDLLDSIEGHGVKLPLGLIIVIIDDDNEICYLGDLSKVLLMDVRHSLEDLETPDEITFAQMWEMRYKSFLDKYFDEQIDNSW